MSRNESDREDLMREAVALVERAELRVPGFDELITVGFRSNSALSLFIGQDPVYQFDPAGRLRRAFVDGFLFRSQHETLARLERVRTDTATQLHRYDLNAEELIHFRQAMTGTLQEINLQLRKHAITVNRAVPEHCEFLPRIQAALASVLEANGWLSREIRRRR